MPGRGRRRAADLIDRDPQNLPVGIGGFRVVRKNRRTKSGVKWWRRNAANVVAAFGMGLALAGAALAVFRAPIPAYISGTSVHIANSVLTLKPGSTGLYIGNAALDYVELPDKTYVATASTTANGKDVAGRCLLSQVNALEIRENCSFWIGVHTTAKPTLTSVDTFDLSSGSLTWTRKYSDGVTTLISVPATLGGVVPVPLPIGH